MARRYKAAGVAATVVLAGGLLAFALPGNAESKPNEGKPNRIVRPVPTAEAEACPLRTVREFPGRVRACQRVGLAFDMDGRLVELNAREGGAVPAGAVLARLDDRDVRNALDAARAHFDDATREFNRAKELRKQNVIAQAEYDRAMAAREIAQANLRLCEKALADATLVAPFAGVIAARNVENHQRVQAGYEILSLQDLSRVEVVIQVPERLIARGGCGALHDVRVWFEADGGRWFDAEARECRSQSDGATHLFDVTVSLPAPQGVGLLPGMTAKVQAQIDAMQAQSSTYTDTVTSEEQAAPVLIPAEAVWTEDAREAFVWVIPEVGGCPQRTRVETGQLRNGRLVVRSGLSAGQHVAVAGLHTLRADTPVRPRKAGKEGLEG